MLDASVDADEALAAWRDELLARYRGCELAPFIPRAPELGEHGAAFSADLERAVGRYRMKPDAGAGERGIDVLDVEVSGNHASAIAALAPLRELHVWPIRNNGVFVEGCHVELVQARRAELCLDDIDDVDRREANVVSTQVRAMVLCKAPLALDEVAVVVLSPDPPPPYLPLKPTPEPKVVDRFFAGINNKDAIARDVACTSAHEWCVGLTSHGDFAVTRTQAAKEVEVQREDLAGFSLATARGPWSILEHTPSGLRVAESAIGSYHAIPTNGQTRWWLWSGDCMVWRARAARTRSYPPHVEAGALCLAQGAWVNGNYGVAPLRGDPRTVTQDGGLDNAATRCRYVK